MPLLLAPLTPVLHQQVVELHKGFGLNPPPYPKEAILVTTEEWDVVASVYLYEATPWLFAEFAIASPVYRRKTVYGAGRLMVEALVARAAMKGLVPFAAPRSRGIELLLKRCGFAPSGTQVWTAAVPHVQLSLVKPVVEIERTAENEESHASTVLGDPDDQPESSTSVSPQPPRIKTDRVRRKTVDVKETSA